MQGIYLIQNKKIMDKRKKNAFLISQFMGWIKATDLGMNNHPNRIYKDQSFMDVRGLNYSSNWKYLMPVVEKIMSRTRIDGSNVYFRTFGMQHEETKEYMVRLDRYSLFKASTLVEATYLAVVEFIEDWFKIAKTTENGKV